ncbi:MAG: FAD-dependent oxidoreductase [Schwartzia sp. (in: firmicutes)]
MSGRENQDLYDAIVIGGGPAGLAAGIYLARACCRVLILEKETFGGQITITAEVVNYPGSALVSGTELTARMRKQAEDFGAEFKIAEVKELHVSGDIREVVTSQGTFRTFGILLATGAKPRTLGFQGEQEFRGHGVAYCATCDGEFFTGKEIFVIGGGFAAAEESVFLTKYAKRVTILMRGDDFSCAASTAREAKEHEKITVRPHAVVEAVEGDSLPRRIIWRDTKTGERTTYAPADGDTIGVFVFAGYEPEAELLRGIAEIDPRGYVVTDREQRTNVPGIYAAGDVCVKELRQVVTAVSDGAVAATGLERYVEKMRTKTGERPVFQERRGIPHLVKENAPGVTVQTEGDGPFPADVLAQLETVFSRMAQPLILRLFLDDRPVSAELRDYMTKLASLTDKLTVEEAAASETEETPCVRVCRSDGSPTGLAFHGVPGGHEFTSFVLGLYNAAGPGQPLAESARARIAKIEKDLHITILVSLTCTMCPELVTSAQRVASLNPRVTTDIYDLNHFPALREKYNVMSVPCFVLNDGALHFGKKNVDQLLDILEE